MLTYTGAELKPVIPSMQLETITNLLILRRIPKVKDPNMNQKDSRQKQSTKLENNSMKYWNYNEGERDFQFGQSKPRLNYVEAKDCNFGKMSSENGEEREREAQTKAKAANAVAEKIEPRE